MTSETMAMYEVNLSITAAEGETVDDGELEATAEEVIEAARTQAAFVALGAVVSVDLVTGSIDLFCNITGENPDDLHSKVARIFDVMLDAANRFEYRSSAMQRGELVPV
ncbi:MAG: hypothetical protein ACYDCH_02340 [Gaiellaceae bacterium]